MTPRLVPIADVMANDSNMRGVSQAMGNFKTTEFSRLPAETAPPVWLNWGMGLAIMDGRHRVAAALLRGDTHILAE